MGEKVIVTQAECRFSRDEWKVEEENWSEERLSDGCKMAERDFECEM